MAQPERTPERLLRALGTYRRAFHEYLGSNTADPARGIALMDLLVEDALARRFQLDGADFRRRAVELYERGDQEALGRHLHQGADADSVEVYLLELLDKRQRHVAKAAELFGMRDERLVVLLRAIFAEMEKHLPADAVRRGRSAVFAEIARSKAASLSRAQQDDLEEAQEDAQEARLPLGAPRAGP